jgi:hypothetical protein
LPEFVRPPAAFGELQLVFQPADQAMDIAEHEQITYFSAIEAEDRHARPPDMSATRRQQFLIEQLVRNQLCLMVKRSAFQPAIFNVQVSSLRRRDRF